MAGKVTNDAYLLVALWWKLSHSKSQAAVAIVLFKKRDFLVSLALLSTHFFRHEVERLKIIYH